MNAIQGFWKRVSLLIRLLVGIPLKLQLKANEVNERTFFTETLYIDSNKF